MNKRNLLIVGMGQYGFVAREIAVAMNCFSKIDFLDDNHPDAIGKMADIEALSPQYDCAVVAIGAAEIRCRCMKDVAQYIPLISLVHPMSYISPSAQIASGCIVEPMAVIHTEVVVAEGCIIGAGAVVNHNSQLQIGCHIDCNATVPARANVPAHTKVAVAQVYAEA